MRLTSAGRYENEGKPSFFCLYDDWQYEPNRKEKDFPNMKTPKTSMHPALAIGTLLAGVALGALAFAKRKAIMAAATDSVTTIKANAKIVADKMADGLLGDPIPAVTGGLNGSGESPMQTPAGH